MSWTGLDEFYDTLTGLFEKQAECLINCIHRRAEGINENIQSTLAHVEKFSPLQNEEHTKEWGTYLASIILTLIYDSDSKMPEKVRSKMSNFFKDPLDINQSPISEPQLDPPSSPPCSMNTASNQEIIDLSQNASTPAKKPSPTSIPPLALSPTSTPAPPPTALVPIQKATDTYMTSTTTTSKRPASPLQLSLPNMKTKGVKLKNRKEIDAFFAKRPRAKLTKSAKTGADLAN